MGTKSSKGKKIGLALGSGGARGLGEIGVLLWLKEMGIEAYCVSGCSIGSIIGAFICSGYTPEHLKKIALEIDWVDILKFLRLSFSTSSIFDWSRISRFLDENLGDKKIEDLYMPFACVAADINTGEEIIFRNGKIVAAVSASSCIPGVFPTVEIMGKSLVDGELVNPVPVDVAFDLGADLVIGVSARRYIGGRPPIEREEEHKFIQRMDEWVTDVLKKAPVPLAELYERIPHPGHQHHGKKERKFYEVVTDSLAIVSSRVMELKRHFSGPHFLIEPEVGEYRNFDFDRAEEIIERGYEAAEESGYELEKFLSGK